MLPEIKLPHNTATKTTLGRVRTGEALAALVGASLEPPGGSSGPKQWTKGRWELGNLKGKRRS